MSGSVLFITVNAFYFRVVVKFFDLGEGLVALTTGVDIGRHVRVLTNLLDSHLPCYKIWGLGVVLWVVSHQT